LSRAADETTRPISAGAAIRAQVRRGLRDMSRTPLQWGLPLGLFSAMIVFVWPSIEDSTRELMKNYPQGLKEAFGLTELDSVESYIAVEMLSFIVPLAVAFLAVRTVARSISGAEEGRWLDTLLATPLTRERLVVGVLIVTAIVVAAVLAVTLALTMVAGVLSGTDPSLAKIGRGMANVWPLAMFFAGVATLLAGRFRGSAAVTATAAGILVGMYLLDVLGRVADELESLRWISAFRHYGDAVRDGIDPLAFVGLTLAGATLAAVGALMLRSRDLAG
jgi:ABC-2 type transport system permease protein